MNGHDWADNPAGSHAVHMYVCTRCGALSGNFVSRPRSATPVVLVRRTNGSFVAVAHFTNPADPASCDTETARKVVES